MKILTSLIMIALMSVASWAQTITVAAAANLKYVLDDLSMAFEKESGIEVKGIFGASGKLTQQIKSGAPFDMFMSADIEFPAKLAAEGYAVTPSKVYAYGTLVLWSTTGADLSRGVEGLASDKINKIAIANPKTAPYGVEALNSMKHFKVDHTLSPKLVTAESIAQVGNFVTTKAVDVGFIAKSIVMSPEMKGIGQWVEVDPKSYNAIDQAMIVLKNGSPENQIAAKKFYNFLQTPKAHEIFKRFGYIIK